MQTEGSTTRAYASPVSCATNLHAQTTEASCRARCVRQGLCYFGCNTTYALPCTRRVSPQRAQASGPPATMSTCHTSTRSKPSLARQRLRLPAMMTTGHEHLHQTCHPCSSTAGSSTWACRYAHVGTPRILEYASNTSPQLVPAVSELVICELLYLQYKDRNKPIYLYINSTGTTRADGETVRVGALCEVLHAPNKRACTIVHERKYLEDGAVYNNNNTAPPTPHCRWVLRLRAHPFLTRCAT